MNLTDIRKLIKEGDLVELSISESAEFDPDGKKRTARSDNSDRYYVPQGTAPTKNVATTTTGYVDKIDALNGVRLASSYDHACQRTSIDQCTWCVEPAAIVHIKKNRRLF